MTAADLSLPVLLVLAAAITVGGVIGARVAAARTGWRPAGGLVLLAATPLIPHVPVVSGLSLDDILPILAILALVAAVEPRPRTAIAERRILAAGLVLVVAAGILSSLVNGDGPTGILTMLLRSPGRYAFLAVIAVLVVLAEPHARRQDFVARAMAGLGTAEAAFGLAAFFLPLGGIGLEATRKHSVLFLEVPGRIAGTLGISPNFLGAIFVLTILLTAGLALASTERRDRVLFWSATTLQMFALTLTFTRASLGIALACLVVLVVLRGGLRALVPVGLAVAIGFALTPALERLTADVPDRFALWTSAGLMTLDHPIAGVGPGRTVEVGLANPERYRETPFGAAQNNAHNTVLLAGAETGIAGAIGALLVNVGLALGALRVIRRARAPGRSAVDTAAGLAILGYLAQGMVNNLFSVAVAGVVFALVVGAYGLAGDPDDEPFPVSASALRQGRRSS